MRRTNTPVIKAIVPPETPGITLAAPIAIPFKKTVKGLFISIVIVFGLKMSQEENQRMYLLVNQALKSQGV